MRKMKKNIEIIVKQTSKHLVENDEDEIGDLNRRINHLKIKERKYGREE